MTESERARELWLRAHEDPVVREYHRKLIADFPEPEAAFKLGWLCGARYVLLRQTEFEMAREALAKLPNLEKAK